MIISLSLIAWILLAALATGIPALLVKEYIRDNNLGWILACSVCYITLVYAYYNIFLSGNISILFPMIKVTAILLIVAMSLLLFGEKLKLKGYVGIALSIAAIFLLSTE